MVLWSECEYMFTCAQFKYARLHLYNFSIETQGLSKSSGVYLNSSIPKSYGNQPSWTLQDGTLVLDLAKGRLDFTHGMDRGLFTNPK